MTSMPCLLLLLHIYRSIFFFFFFNDTATTEIYTLSLHDALPISSSTPCSRVSAAPEGRLMLTKTKPWSSTRSEEHTSELQSQSNLVCRLLLEKKKKTPTRRVEFQDDRCVYMVLSSDYSNRCLFRT